MNTAVKATMNPALVISAMPAAGKSTLTEICTLEGIKVADSDSSKFNFVTDENNNYLDAKGNVTTEPSSRVKNPKFEAEYIADIKRKIEEGNEIVFVSAHTPVRELLNKHEIPFFYVTYKESMKEEVVQRILNRKSNQPNEMISRITNENWDLFMSQKGAGNPIRVIELGTGEYLSDHISDIVMEHLRYLLDVR